MHALDPRSWPIRWRLTALNVGVLALTLALLGGFLLLQLDSALIAITTDHLRDQARLAVPPEGGPGGPGGRDGDGRQGAGPKPGGGFPAGPQAGERGPEGFTLERAAPGLVRRLSGPDTGALVFNPNGVLVAESLLETDVEDWPRP